MKSRCVALLLLVVLYGCSTSTPTKEQDVVEQLTEAIIDTVYSIESIDIVSIERRTVEELYNIYASIYSNSDHDLKVRRKEIIGLIAASKPLGREYTKQHGGVMLKQNMRLSSLNRGHIMSMSAMAEGSTCSALSDSLTKVDYKISYTDRKGELVMSVRTDWLSPQGMVLRRYPFDLLQLSCVPKSYRDSVFISNYDESRLMWLGTSAKVVMPEWDADITAYDLL